MKFNWINTALMGAGTKKAPLPRASRLDQRFSYLAYLPKGFSLEKGSDYRLFVLIHGTTRNAEKMKERFMDFADETKTVLLAPFFPCGIIDREDIHNYKFLKYKDIDFGEIAVDMIQDVTETFHLDPYKKILISGFSGGGQFVHRFMYRYPELLEAACIGAPGRSTYLDKEEDWPSGIKNWEEIFGTGINFEALTRIKICLIAGDQDTEKISYEGDASFNPAMYKYGNTRVERLKALQKNYQEFGLHCDLRLIPGAGHDWTATVDDVKEFLKGAHWDEENI